LSRDFKSRFITLTMLSGGFLLPFALLVLFYLLVLNSIKRKDRAIRQLFFAQQQQQQPQRTSSTSSTIILLNNERNHPTSAFYYTTLKNNNPNSVSSSSSFALAESSSSCRRIRPRSNRRKSDMTSSLARREFRVTKTVVIFISAFCFAWLPYITIIVAAQFGLNVEDYFSPLVANLPSIFVKCSTVFNPLIYTVMNPKCQVHFMRLTRFK
jgi:hypothetical protein